VVDEAELAVRNTWRERDGAGPPSRSGRGEGRIWGLGALPLPPPPVSTLALLRCGRGAQ